MTAQTAVRVAPRILEKVELLRLRKKAETLSVSDSQREAGARVAYSFRIFLVIGQRLGARQRRRETSLPSEMSTLERVSHDN